MHHISRIKKKVLDDLKNYLLTDGNSLDGDEIQRHLFPSTDIDIFLSHSHGDEDDVIKLAIILEKKRVESFCRLMCLGECL